MATLDDDLMDPGRFPGPRSANVSRIETHCSTVYLLEDRVYKLKKHVNLGFLDFTTLEGRRSACEAELVLNRRLAPEVYRGVLPVVRDSDGKRRIAGDGSAIDWAVWMVRLPDEARADLMLARGALDSHKIETIARFLARFHASCRVDETTAPYGAPERILVNVVENFAQASPVIDGYLTAAEAREIEAWQTEFLRRQERLLLARIAARRVRDGHGDLRLEHVYFLPSGPVVIDCIEFNERFRYADVASDLAFLSMDLAAHERVDLAEQLLSAYAQESNDYGLYSVIDFYESYRAYVRAKIAAMMASDARSSDKIRAAAREQARRHFILALSADRTPLLQPRLVVIGGLPASGKSTVAAKLSRILSAPIVAADRTRKSLLGVEATEHIEVDSWAGAYDKKFTEKVYEEMIERARIVLESGRPVILDGSFRAKHLRAAARALAEKHGAPFLFVECRAAREVCRARLEHRGQEEDVVSDARADLFDDFARAWEAVNELPSEEHLIIKSEGATGRLEELLESRFGS